MEYHSLFDDVIGHYKIASENLKKVAELFPCFSVTEEQRAANVKDKNLCREAIEYLKVVREAEAAGLECLGRIVGGALSCFFNFTQSRQDAKKIYWEDKGNDQDNDAIFYLHPFKKNSILMMSINVRRSRCRSIDLLLI